MAKEGKLNNLIIVLFILVGILSGAILSEALISSVPFMAKGLDIGLNPPAVINLYVFSVTIGFTFKFNLGSALGAVIGYLVGKKVA